MTSGIQCVTDKAFEIKDTLKTRVDLLFHDSKYAKYILPINETIFEKILGTAQGQKLEIINKIVACINLCLDSTRESSQTDFIACVQAKINMVAGIHKYMQSTLQELSKMIMIQNTLGGGRKKKTKQLKTRK